MRYIEIFYFPKYNYNNNITHYDIMVYIFVGNTMTI